MMLQIEGPQVSDTDEDLVALLRYNPQSSSRLLNRQRALTDVEKTPVLERLIASLRRLLGSGAVHEPPSETRRQVLVSERRTPRVKTVVKPMGVWLMEHPAGLYAR